MQRQERAKSARLIVAEVKEGSIDNCSQMWRYVKRKWVVRTERKREKDRERERERGCVVGVRGRGTPRDADRIRSEKRFACQVVIGRSSCTHSHWASYACRAKALQTSLYTLRNEFQNKYKNGWKWWQNGCDLTEFVHPSSVILIHPLSLWASSFQTLNAM